jgi:hypothetical protein
MQRIMIAARRKDFAAVSAVVETSPQDPFYNPADKAIAAFLEEGDWRGAAAIAETYDLRKRPVLRGFSDTRKRDYMTLQLTLAASAARAGEPGAAELFLASYKLAHLLMPDPPREDDDDEEGEHVDPAEPASEAHSPPSQDPIDLWPATLIAGVAEGRLPAASIGMFLSVLK